MASDAEEEAAGTGEENEGDSDKEEGEIWKVRGRAVRPRQALGSRCILGRNRP